MVDEIIIARIVLIIISCLMIIGITKLKRSQRIGKQVFGIIVIFWSIVLVVAIEPSVLKTLQESTALNNTAQFLLILSVIIILYLLLIQVYRGKSTSYDLYRIVRSIALVNFKASHCAKQLTLRVTQ